MNDLAKTTGLFILGSSRSGTTLLHGILQQLPYYARYQAEPMLLYQSKTKYRNINSAKAKKRFLKDWYNSRQFIRSGLTEKDFSELFNRKGITHSNLLKEFMELIALKQGCSHWIDSTPDNVFALNHIKTTFPNSKIIHMIRDGRAVSLSLAKLDWAGIQSSNMNKKLNFSALKWQLAINAAKQSIPTLGNQILEIKYEDLATKPETTLADIMFFIGHGDDLNKLNLNKVKTNSAFQDIKNGISSVAAYRWKKLLTEAQILMLEQHIGKTLIDYSYQLNSNTNPNLTLKTYINSKRLYLMIKKYSKENTFLGTLGKCPLELGET